ncbi:MAG: hypothetical protein FWC47_15510 [Oscillospiraceae bacterium]|nr:hypothetical protein [Oscillospiraceae bacterium]
MRADIAASLLHSPKVLFLDEPTIGLDVVVKDNIRKAIAQICTEERTTVILTTHDLSDIELLCKRIVMINKGEKVFDGKLQNLKSQFGQMRELNFEVINPEETKKLNYCQWFNVSNEEIEIKQDGISITVRFNCELVPVSKILQFTLENIAVKDINVKDADVEEIIRRLYKHEVTLNE